MLNILDPISREWVDRVALSHRCRYSPGFTSLKDQRRLCPFVPGTAHNERWWLIYLAKEGVDL